MAKKAQQKKGRDIKKWYGRLGAGVVKIRSFMLVRIRGFLARRPHRSFRRTSRRDYTRSLQLPGYWAFTNEVRRLLKKHIRTMLGLFTVYTLLAGLFVGLASQEVYTEINKAIREVGGEVSSGNFANVGDVGLYVAAGLTGGLGQETSQLQQVYGAIITLLVWLTTVWLLRAYLAGGKPKLRDGLYSAGAPFVSTFLVAFFGILQLLPMAIGAIGVGAAASAGLMENGVEAMVVWAVVLLLTTLSVYWLSATLIALVVVTLPGMYPMRAIRTAGDLVMGRRLRIIYRLLWLVLTIVFAWIIVLLPLLLFDTWIKGVVSSIEWLPIIPMALLVMGTATVMWSSAYIYSLYRKVVDDDARPA